MQIQTNSFISFA